jgi:hypothetical protein
MSMRRPLSRPWFDHIIRPTKSARKAPISGSTSTSIGRWPAPGAKASAFICRDPGSSAPRARAISSCRAAYRAGIR